jgi:hypothetical protein
MAHGQISLGDRPLTDDVPAMTIREWQAGRRIGADPQAGRHDIQAWWPGGARLAVVIANPTVAIVVPAKLP